MVEEVSVVCDVIVLPSELRCRAYVQLPTHPRISGANAVTEERQRGH